ncbi:hypothetical protein B0T21DRAFT_261570, partial [Apiosordaria backusii]
MNPQTPKEVWIARLLETFPLTILDEHAPTIYSRLVYGFSFPGTDKIPAAVEHLQQGLQRVFRRWPFLAGQIMHQVHSSKTRLVYTKNHYDFNISIFPNEVFRHEILTKGKFSHSYQQLAELG